MRHSRKTLMLFRRYAAISLRTESEFRPDFWTSVIQLVLNAVLVIVFWDALFRLTGPVKGWTLADLVMMAGLGELSRTVSGLFPGLNELPDGIVKGNLDRYLTRPAPAILCYLWERISLVRIFHSFVAGMLIVSVAVWQLNFPVTFKGTLAGLALMIIGRLAFMLLQGAISMLAFWVGRIQHVQAVLAELGQFNRFPVVFFDSPVRLFLTWVWPYGLYLTYPTLFIRGDLTNVWILLAGAALLTTSWGLTVRFMLQAGLRRYESFGG